MIWLRTSKIGFQKCRICEACQFRMQIKTCLKKKSHVSTSKPHQLLYMDLFGTLKYASLTGKYYAFVIVVDFSKYIGVLFGANNDDAFDAFKFFCKNIQNEKGYIICRIRRDYGGQFENHDFEMFCNNFGH